MIDLLRSIIPYISGLYTLPWILVGFVVTNLLSFLVDPDRLDTLMKRIGLIILYCFVPILIFRIFLDTVMGISELRFLLLSILCIALMYLLAWLYAKYQIRRQGLEPDKAALYLKTVVTNQGRSSAFVGGAMLAIPGWTVDAAIFMAMVGIMLFAVMPYILAHMSSNKRKAPELKLVLPWFLRFYPWFFISFVLAAIIMQKSTGISTADLGNFGVILRFYSALTIPAALYYVGSGIHLRDLKLTELQKLLGVVEDAGTEHWSWVRQIFRLTTIYTPLLFALVFGLLLHFKLIPGAWFAVIILNTVLPITGTNMFLVPYGLDKRATAHSVTWSTIVNVPIVVILIEIFSRYLG
jgi:hypothetical protein